MKRKSESRHISILHRLRTRAKEEKLPIKSILPYYGMECFLHRLSKSQYCNSLILKGGLIFNALDVPLRRSTKDIDFQGYVENDIEALIRIVEEICVIPVKEDGIEFDTDSITVDQIMHDAYHEGVRIRFIGYLGKSRIPLQLDFSFVDVITPEAIELEYPTLLDRPSFKILGYPLETIIAEKLETIVKRAEFNSRRKDFYDLWLLSKLGIFSGPVLLSAINATFQNRGTTIPESPIVALSDGFAEQNQNNWSSFLNREELSNPDIDDFVTIVRDLRLFLQPALDAAIKGTPFKSIWELGGPWIS